jgi:hypothetical protein
MKPTEFRIGNLLEEKLTGTLLKVVDINESGFATYVIDRSKYPMTDGWQAQPIPLTPELLEKCGFVRSQDEDENSLTLVNGRKTFKWVEGNDGDYFLIYQTDCGLDYNTAFELEHLHELQNLYFPLTGEELEINL